MAALLGFIHTRLHKGKLFQADLERGVNHVTVWKVLNGKGARPETVRRIAVAAGTPALLRDRAVAAAEILHSHALSQGHRARPPRVPAPLLAPPQPVPPDVRKRCTPRGLWFVELVYARYGSPEAFCRAAPMKDKTYDRWCFDGTFYPRDATVKTVARTLSVLGHDPVTYEDALLRYGGKTYEDYRQQDAQAVAASRPPCPICGQPILRQPSRRPSQHATCSYDCDIVRRIVSDGIETELGRWLAAVMTDVAKVPADRIARLLNVPMETVAAWLHEWGALVEEIREAMKASAKRPRSLMQATAHVLHMSPDALRALLHHRIRHPDRQHRGRRRTVAPEYLRGKTLAALAAFFGRSEKEILAAAGRSGGTMSNFYKTHGARASVQRKIFRRKTKGPSLKLNTHRAVQFILRAAYRGDPLDTIRETLDDARLPGSDDPMWTARQHAKTCTPCRALEAAWLHELQAKTNDEIGTLFGCSEAWAGTLVKRGLGAMHHPTPTLEKLLAKPYSIRVSEGPSI